MTNQYELDLAYEKFMSARAIAEKGCAKKTDGDTRSDSQIFYDAIIGVIVGDAVGVPFECGWRDQYKITDMVGYEEWMPAYHETPIPIGTWSDDSALTLATIDSYRRCGKLDSDDLLQSFCNWYYNDKYIPEGQTRFGEGRITVRAFEKFRSGTPADECGCDELTALGNGALMRIMPLAFYPHTAADIARVSAVTHANKVGIMACICYIEIAEKLIEGMSLREAVKSIDWPEIEEFSRMADIASYPRDEIRSSGHVIETLEAALWCLLTTDSYRDCVITAVNLGRDTDTVAAVAGGLAGIYYGTDSEANKGAVPAQWIENLQPGYEEYVCS